MSKIDCHTLVWSTSRHLSVVRTGLTLLAREGAIRLSQQIVPHPPAAPGAPRHLHDARTAHMWLIVNDSLRIYIDGHDSPELDGEALEQCDVYFKRSLVTRRIPAAARDRVLPLGLHYTVYADGFDPFEAERERRLGDARMPYGLRVAAARMLGAGRYAQHVARLRAPPDLHCEPRVLFMTQVWDVESARLPAQGGATRHSLNEMRAECIVRLRRELGQRFFGGLRPTAYARQHFPHALLPDEHLAERGRYLRTLREFPICVTTAGLHGSVGSKLAEYVAFSKAIVSERLDCELPGTFAERSNYLPFSDVESCVARALELMENAALRRSMMLCNWSYYRSFLRPDELVRNVLAAALAHSPAGCRASDPSSRIPPPPRFDRLEKAASPGPT
jgi:hypothetical protein